MKTAKSGGNIRRAADPGVGADLDAVLDAALTERLSRFTVQAKKARSYPTEKVVHDLRVASRRLMAVLDIVKNIYPGYGGAGIRKQMKAQLKSLSDLRDTQVQILEVQQLAADYGVLSAFLGELIIREATRTKHTRKGIQHIDVEAIEEYLGRLRTNLHDFLSAPAMDEICRTILIGLLAQMYLKTSVLRKDIARIAGNKDYPAEICGKIHRLRLIFKSFRYTVEVMKPMLPHVSLRTLKRMSEYQSNMGSIQDTEVLIAAISLHAKRIRKKERKSGASVADGFGPVLDQLQNRLRQESDEFVQTMDELDDYWRHIA